MAKLIKGGRVMADSWRVVPLAKGQNRDSLRLLGGDLILPLSVWKCRKWEFISRQWGTGGRLGVWLTTAEGVETLAEDWAHLDLIAIDFSAPSDGRGYSQARLLRRFGFRGELRAIGAIERDYLPFLMRVGFDAFVLADDEAEESLVSLRPYSAAYQPDADNVIGVFALERGV